MNALSARALAYEVIEVSRVARMLKAAHTTEEVEAARGTVVRLPAGRFAREASAFAIDLIVDGESYRPRLEPQIDDQTPQPAAPVESARTVALFCIARMQRAPRLGVRERVEAVAPRAAEQANVAPVEACATLPPWPPTQA